MSLFLADGLGSGDVGSGDFQMGKLLRGFPRAGLLVTEASSLGRSPKSPVEMVPFLPNGSYVS